MEQVEVKIEADSHEEAVAKLREGDFEAELIVETYPAGMWSENAPDDAPYGCNTIWDEDDNEIYVADFAEVA
jgi:hypothetical protein